MSNKEASLLDITSESNTDQITFINKIKVEDNFSNEVEAKLGLKYIKEDIKLEPEDEGSKTIKQEQINIKDEPTTSYTELDIDNTNVNLPTHMKVHTGVKLFSCSFCKFRTAWKKSLTHHMKVHTGVKLFSCSFCKYRTAWKSSLTYHMSTCFYKRVTRKSFTCALWLACNLCEYRAVKKSDLITHKKIHVGEKLLFACDLCEFKAAAKTTLVRHRKIHFGGNSYYIYDNVNKC